MEGLLRLRSVSQAQREFAEFYEASRDACLRAVIAGSGDAGHAEDMVAEAFARAWGLLVEGPPVLRAARVGRALGAEHGRVVVAAPPPRNGVSSE